MDELKKLIIPFLVGVALVACMLTTYQIGRGIGYDKGFAEGIVAIPPRTDTMWREKPVYIEKPVEVVKWKEKEKPVYIPVTDTIHHHDTTFLALPREFKQYKEETFEAQVSGIDPSLDWINVNQKTAYIQNTITTRKRWSVGFSAGPGLFWDGREIKPGAGIVAGVQYNF